jgi:hypothetical protein
MTFDTIVSTDSSKLEAKVGLPAAGRSSAPEADFGRDPAPVGYWLGRGCTAGEVKIDERYPREHANLEFRRHATPISGRSPAAP